MKTLKIFFWAMLIVLLLAQFLSPDKNQDDGNTVSAFLLETKPPSEVQEILAYCCYDCHSNHTNYPWYNAITPINYWLSDNITEGKSKLNFSKWNDYSTAKKDDKLAEIIEVVSEKEMPLESYTWIHQEANLSHDQMQELVNWAKQLRFKYSLESKPQ